MLYLDYQATTPVDPRVAERIHHYMVTEFGNPSSSHDYGHRAAAAIQQAAQQVADLISATPRQLVWTSGATESINLAIQGSLPPNPKIPHRIALLPLEHKAVLDSCQALEKRGWAELIYLNVDRQGRLDLDQITQLCTAGLSLLCVMAANNEIGNIYPIQTIAQIAQRHQIPLLCDASQAVGKIPIQFTPGSTYLALSSHKLYGPKGVGALVARKGYPLQPLLFGGGQQQGIRPGSLNVPGIVGLGEACKLRLLEMATDEPDIAAKRDHLQTLLRQQIPNLILNGDLNHRLAGSLHIAIPDVPNSAVIARTRHQLAISTGSACNSGVEAPSHVLQALRLPNQVLDGALRISLGKFTTAAEIPQAAEILATQIRQIQQLVP